MEDQSHQLLAVAVSFFILSWTTAILRVYVRAGILRSFGRDDWLMMLTLLIFTIYFACVIGGVTFGTGRHIWDLKRQNAEKALRFWYLCEVFYILSSCVLKIALCVFLLRISVHPVHVWILRLLIVGTALFGTFYEGIAIFQCTPISAFWKDSPGSTSCVGMKVILGSTYAASVINAIADWTIGILPAFIVRNLNMARRTKIIVAALLSFAAIGNTATVIRIWYVHRLADTDDFLWRTTTLAVLSTIEIGIGIAAGCIATLRPLLHLILYRAGISSSHPESRTRPINRRSHRGYRLEHDLTSLTPQKPGTGIETTSTRQGNPEADNDQSDIRTNNGVIEIGIARNATVDPSAMETQYQKELPALPPEAATSRV